eukprot:583168-Rhodomonas_salina.1
MSSTSMQHALHTTYTMPGTDLQYVLRTTSVLTYSISYGAGHLQKLGNDLADFALKGSKLSKNFNPLLNLGIFLSFSAGLASAAYAVRCGSCPLLVLCCYAGARVCPVLAWPIVLPLPYHVSSTDLGLLGLASAVYAVCCCCCLLLHTVLGPARPARGASAAFVPDWY